MKNSKILILVTVICIFINISYINSIPGLLLLIINILILLGLYINYHRIVDIFSPISIAYISFIISFSMKGLYILNTEKFNFDMLYIPLIYIIIFIFFFNIGLFIRLNNRKLNLRSNLISRTLKVEKVGFVSFLCCILGLLIYIFKVEDFNILYLMNNLLNNRKKFQNNGGLYYQTIILLLVQSAFYINLLLFYKGDRTKNRKLILFIIFILNFFITFTLGGRGMILTPILIIFLYKFKITGKISFKNLFLVGCIFVIFSGWYGIVRDGISPGTTITENFKVSSLIDNVIDRYVQLDNFIRLANNPIDYQFGQSFVDIILSPIPRSIFPDKPYNFNSQMTQVYHPNQFKNLIVTDFTMLGEFLINFGIVGLVFGGLIFGILMRIVNRMYLKENDFFYFWYPFMFLKPMSMIYGGMINSTVNMMIVLETPIIILLWIFYTRKSNKIKCNI